MSIDGLSEAIDGFRRLHPELGTPRGARNQCLEASTAFLDYLMEMGLIALDEPGWRWEVLEVGQKNAECDHHVVRVEDTLIDWTARQFDASADFPAVTIDRGLWDHCRKIAARSTKVQHDPLHGLRALLLPVDAEPDSGRASACGRRT